jgi:aminocarboxymuconate-semialdehyde decarboxylase
MQSSAHAIPELRRCITELGMVGVQIGSHVNDLVLGDEKLFPIFEEAERLGACIFVHPWDMTGETLMKKYWLPWLVGMPMESAMAICSMMFSGLFAKLPNLRVCFAHGGGAFPGTIGRIEHGYFCRPDLVAVDCKTPPRSWMGHFWLDSLTHDAAALQTIVDLVGEERVMMGTDYPFPLGEIQMGALIDSMSTPLLHTHTGEVPTPLSDDQRAKWTEERKRKMLWRNALEFLGVDHQEQKYLIDWAVKKKGTSAGSSATQAEEKSKDRKEAQELAKSVEKLALDFSAK